MITLKGFRVPHARYVAAYKQVKTAIECAGDEGICIPLLGPTRTGKTDLLDKLSKEFAGRGVGAVDHVAATGIAVGTIRPKPNDAELYAAVLRAANAQIGVRDRLSTLQNRMLRLVPGNRIKTIALDEASHCVEPSANLNRRAAADHFKHIIDTTKSVLILAGLPKLQALLDQNEQLAARSMATVELLPYRWHEPEDREEFLAFVLSTFDYIADRGATLEFDPDDMARRLYAASGGRVGVVVNLLETALRRAPAEHGLTFADVARGFSTRMQATSISDLIFAPESPTDEEMALSFAHVFAGAGLMLPEPINSDEFAAFLEIRKKVQAA